MRILFFGDLQLESGRGLGNGAEYGEGSRFHDQQQVLQRLLILADQERVDAVVNVGDTFHFPRPAPHAILAYQSFARFLRQVPHVILLGNHDVRSADLPSIIGAYYGGVVELATEPRVVPAGDVVFACLPWAPTSTIVAATNGSADVKRLAVDALVRTAQELRMRCGEEYPDAAPILLGHWSVSGSTLPNGSLVADMPEPVIPWEDIDVLDYRLAAFGHIHQPQVIAAGASKTPMFYVGSTFVQNFGEAGTPHGAWIYDTAANELRFVEVADRPFVTIDYDPDDVEGSVPAVALEDAVVRVRYQTTEARPVDEAEVRRMVFACGASKVLIKGEVVKQSRARVEAASAEVTLEQSVDLWLQSRNAAQEWSEEAVAGVRAQHARYVEALRDA